TSGLQEVLLAYAGEVRKRKDSRFDYTPLLVTGPVSGVLKWEDFARQSFNPMTFSPDLVLKRNPPYSIDEEVHAVAARVKGDEEGDPNVVFVADVDMISDWFFEIRLQDAELVFDNVAFVLNAVDVLSGDDAYVDLRKRRGEQRTLKRVEAQTAAFEKSLNERIAEARRQIEDEIKKRQASFDERRKEIENNTGLSERVKRQQLALAAEDEQQRMAAYRQDLETRLNRQIEELTAQKERRVRETENEFWLYAVLFPPLPAIVLGLSVLLSRLLRERREMDPERTVRG
ncbi:MAG TPA: hypothetical protein VF170_11675, partial [Planctomycetaceae bacterium]